MLITIFSLEGCSYSRNAENLVKSKLNSKNFNIIRVPQSQKEIYKDKHNYPTFPHVFVDNILIGGYTELQEFLNKLLA